MQIAMNFFFLPEFPDFCRKKLRQKVLCNGALVLLPNVMTHGSRKAHKILRKSLILTIFNITDIDQDG